MVLSSPCIKLPPCPVPAVRRSSPLHTWSSACRAPLTRRNKERERPYFHSRLRFKCKAGLDSQDYVDSGDAITTTCGFAPGL
ncbi:hypothetical protein FRC12_023694 [Ceratobasidium sp. 428]|nr:hypothetical protein FRC12_023694 [Ceratobasidium sp. 428]